MDHTVPDHTSVLMIEWRHGLGPLTERDAAANNLATALDFKSPANLAAPSYAVPSFVGLPCLPAPLSTYPTGAASGYEEWYVLRDLAKATGYSVGA